MGNGGKEVQDAMNHNKKSITLRKYCEIEINKT